jgi:hypothetical protein
LVSRDASTLADVDLATGREVRRIERLPVMGRAWFGPDGYGLGIRRTAAVGQGPTVLRFLAADGRVAAAWLVPNATSQIARSADRWYVGCRNGLLYAFTVEGALQWTWEMPGAWEHVGNVYLRPCPYHVVASPAFVVVTSFGHLYAVGPSGQTIWQASLPNAGRPRAVTIARAGASAWRPTPTFRGLSADGTRVTLTRAAPRWAQAPNRSLDDRPVLASVWHARRASEPIGARTPSRPTGADLTISLEGSGVGPVVSAVSATAEGVLVGSSDGRFYRFDRQGRVVQTRVLGTAPVRFAPRADGTAGATWCGGTLRWLNDDTILTGEDTLTCPRGVTMLGDAVVVWRDREIHLMTARGRVIGAVAVAAPLTHVVATGDRLVCAATGVLAAFKRMPP